MRECAWYERPAHTDHCLDFLAILSLESDPSREFNLIYTMRDEWRSSTSSSFVCSHSHELLWSRCRHFIWEMFFGPMQMNAPRLPFSRQSTFSRHLKYRSERTEQICHWNYGKKYFCIKKYQINSKSLAIKHFLCSLFNYPTMSVTSVPILFAWFLDCILPKDVPFDTNNNKNINSTDKFVLFAICI